MFIRLFTTCCKRTLSVTIYFLLPSGISSSNSTPGGIFNCWESCTFFNSKGRLCRESWKSIVPDSIRDKSRISLINASNRLQFLLMVAINCATSSSVKALVSLNKSEKPTIAFNGVRISWLILAKNADFSLSACNALSRAIVNSSSVVLYRWILWQTPKILYGVSAVNPPSTEVLYSHHSYPPFSLCWRKLIRILRPSFNAKSNCFCMCSNSSG
ncbi:unknown [Bacteroides sp. CAG:189]|nr:unknown [Bacteroides sp. CAG:189]